MKYHLIAFGCQFNKSDSERAAAIFEKMGYQPASDLTKADLVLVLACSVRQTAIDRIFGLKRKFEQIKKHRPLVTVLSGCVLKSDEKKMLEFFDFIIPNADLARLPKLMMPTSYKLIPTSFFNVHPAYISKFQAYVPIMTGCDNFCSYCVVPYTRGREVSRPAAEVIKECRELVKRGYKEIVLIGQNVNSYAGKVKNQNSKVKRASQKSKVTSFPELLEKIDSIAGDYWLSFATSHPKDMSDELIKVMAGGKHIMPYLHLPVQSGDDEILRKMNRHYTAARYRRLVDKARKAVPELMLSTDVIVGFPGESKAQFNNTAKLFRAVKFDMAYVAQYSPRAGTASAKMADNVSREEKKRREKALTEILKQTALANNKKYLKKTVRVLVDGYKKGRCYGRTETFKIVSFAGGQSLIGNFVSVKIAAATSWALAGEQVNQETSDLIKS